MKYCMQCGCLLQQRFKEHEGMLPYCGNCGEYRYPYSDTAVSMILLSPKQDQVLLIQQYGKKDYILVAGYVNPCESLEAALQRECKEETGRAIIAFQYLKSAYFEKSNTLMCSFAAVVDSTSLKDISTWEIDHAQWFSLDEALQVIKPDSLAKQFYMYYLKQRKHDGILPIHSKTDHD